MYFYHDKSTHLLFCRKSTSNVMQLIYCVLGSNRNGATVEQKKKKKKKKKKSSSLITN